MVNSAALSPIKRTYGQPNSEPVDPLINQYKLYDTAVKQQSGDYGNIMKAYQDYQSGPAMTNLVNLSQTGGYSPEDISSIRERGISPIRSVYASANRDVDRTKALQGGYSPNYNAVKAKMAREMSDTISNQTNNVNAGIAQNVAQNKLSIAPNFASAAFRPIEGMQSLYGTTPAMSALFGNQALQHASLQNNINQENTDKMLRYGTPNSSSALSRRY